MALNPIIRGWANYYRHVVSSEIFGKIDHAIWRATWKWSKRRHPKKPLRWIKKKYSLIKRSFPVLLSHIAEPYTGLVDTIFVSKLGSAPLAAVHDFSVSYIMIRLWGGLPF